jgi:hypothetical protein
LLRKFFLDHSLGQYWTCTILNVLIKIQYWPRVWSKKVFLCKFVFYNPKLPYNDILEDLIKYYLLGTNTLPPKSSTDPESNETVFFSTNLNSSPQIYPKMIYLKARLCNTFWRPITCGPQACYRPLVTAVALDFQPSYFSYIVL